jgi:hypothetical protein
MMMLAIGLVLGERVNRVFGSGTYWIRSARNNDRRRFQPGSGSSGDANAPGRNDNYLEKFVTEYEIIPLMSKLI